MRGQFIKVLKAKSPLVVMNQCGNNRCGNRHTDKTTPN